MFHEVKGNNISFDKYRKTANWNPVQTGGLVFTDIHISPTQPVILKLEGTGAVELGIISYDPTLLLDQVPESASKLRDYLFLNDVKIHRRTCTMEINLNPEKKEILSSYGGGHYRQEVDCNKPYWLVADVKYGKVDMKLHNNENQNDRYEFSDICGNNIKRLNDPCSASSQRKSPASFCFYHEPISEGKQYVVRCTPRQYQGTVPGRYYVTLYYSLLNPEDFREKNAGIFDVLQHENIDQSLGQDIIKVENFEKEDCTGNPILISYSDNKLTHKSAMGKRSWQPVRTNATELWFVFELYGVSATVNVIDNPEGFRTGDINNVDGISPIMPDIPEETVDSVNFAIVGSNTTPPNSSNGARPVCGPRVDDPVELRDVIQSNFTALRDSFSVEEFIDYMFEQHLLTQIEMTDIGTLCGHSKHQATKRVLMRLSSCPVSKKFMIKALEKTKQLYLTRYFFPDDEKE